MGADTRGSYRMRLRDAPSEVIRGSVLELRREGLEEQALELEDLQLAVRELEEAHEERFGDAEKNEATLENLEDKFKDAIRDLDDTPPDGADVEALADYLIELATARRTVREATIKQQVRDAVETVVQAIKGALTTLEDQVQEIPE